MSVIRQGRLWITAACCCLFAIAVIHNLIVKTLADERTAISIATLRRAVAYFPSAARLNARLANAELSESENRNDAFARAEAAAIKSTKLSPHDYRMWLALAEVRREQNNLIAEETALRQALSLAPNYTEVRWLLANLLVRADRKAEAINEFSIAAQVRPELLPASLDLVWQISGNDLQAISKVAGEKSEARLTLANYLIHHSRESEALDVFNKIDHQARFASNQSAEFINYLIEQNKLPLARELWLDTLGEPHQPIYNGGFEAARQKGFDQFDWQINNSDYATITITSKQPHSGAKSLRLTFTGQHTTRLNGELKQFIAVNPGKRYRLQCYAKTEKLVTSEGPVIAVTKSNNPDWIVNSKPITTETEQWQPLTIDFTAPQDSAVLLLTIKRTPKFSYDDPMTGTIWLDDFMLSEQ